MKNKLIYTASILVVLFSLNTIAQTRISRVSDYDYNIENRSNRNRLEQTKIVQEEINHLEMASTQVGKTYFPNVYQFKSKKLVLNGAGLREIFWLDLYAAGLYLTKKSNNARFIVGSEKPMVMRLDILSNKTQKDKLIKAFKQGFAKSNTQKVVEKFEKELDTFISFLDVDINVGDKYDIVYKPGIGTTLYVNYENKGTINGLGFKAALFNIWLSDSNPADKSLKEELVNSDMGL